jgi:peptidoglycan hydrolase-like protein with peptidoglycan-binding domain
MSLLSQIVVAIATLVMGLQGVVANLPYSNQVAQVSSQKIGQVLGASTPELPRAYVDTSLPATSNTCTINVASGGDLQAAIDAAKLGDTICLQAGATFTGHFVLPKKTTGSGWVTIRTANLGSNFVAPGTRVSPSDASKMAKLVSPGSNAPAIQTKTSAANYRIIGLEITKQSPDVFVSELVILGDWWQSRLRNGVDTLVEEQPKNIIFDRVYIHGDMVSETKRGIRMHCNNCAVIDSHISQIQSSWQDTQAIMGWNAVGPFKFVNNFLEATGENIMFGGADPSVHFEPTVSAGATRSSATLSSVDGLVVGKGIMFTVGGKTGDANWTTVRSISGNNITFDALASVPDSNSKAYHGVVPSDFEIRKNHFFKPAYWNPKHPSYAGKNYAVKNLFETKSMQRILLDSNVFENSWMSAQIGYGLLIKSSNQDSGCPYCTAQDVTITNNIIKNVEVGIMFQGSESYNDWNKLTPVTKRVKVQNNLFYNEPSWTNELSRGVQIYNGTSDVEFNHNTIFSAYNTFFTNYEDNVRNPNISLTNNIFERSAYGFGNVNEGKGYLDTYFPNYTYAKNVLINTSSRYADANTSNENLLRMYPTGTLVSSFSGVGFVDSANGNFKLSAGSPYKNAGTDGKDIGVDMDALNSAIAGVVTGNGVYVPPVTPTPTPAPSDTTAPTISSISADSVGWLSTNITWNTNELSTSKVEYGNTSSLGSSVQTDSSRKNSHNILLEGLTPGTTYYYKVKSSDSAGNEAVSELKTFKTKDRLVKPPKPQTLNARKGSVILDWSSVDYDLCRNIKIYKSTSGYISVPNESSLVTTLGCSEITFRDVNVSPGTYYYSLFTVDDLGVYSDPMFVQFVVEAEAQASVSSPVSSGGGGGGSSSPGSSSGRRNVSTIVGTGSITASNTTTCTPSNFVLNRNLAFRSEGEDVKNLQSFLMQKGYTTADNITGFFGPITVESIKKFQRDNNIVSSGDYRVTGYGMAGPVTRTKINSMLGNSCGGGSNQSGTSQTNQMLQDQIKVLQKQVQDLLLKLQQSI